VSEYLLTLLACAAGTIDVARHDLFTFVDLLDSVHHELPRDRVIEVVHIWIAGMVDATVELEHSSSRRVNLGHLNAVCYENRNCVDEVATTQIYERLWLLVGQSFD
jgi:hypothetical protein